MSGFGDLAAQALNSADGEEDIEKQIQDALACPCVADLREGPCGSTFVEAFTCYIRSSHEEKGMDCIDQFKLFQECLAKHPDHVDQIVKDAEEVAIADESRESMMEVVVEQVVDVGSTANDR